MPLQKYNYVGYIHYWTRKSELQGENKHFNFLNLIFILKRAGVILWTHKRQMNSRTIICWFINQWLQIWEGRGSFKSPLYYTRQYLSNASSHSPSLLETTQKDKRPNQWPSASVADNWAKRVKTKGGVFNKRVNL